MSAREVEEGGRSQSSGVPVQTEANFVVSMQGGAEGFLGRAGFRAFKRKDVFSPALLSSVSPCLDGIESWVPRRNGEVGSVEQNNGSSLIWGITCLEPDE